MTRPGAAGPAAPTRPRALLWLAAATWAGAAVMGLEMTAARLLAPYFGASAYVWGALIAMVLAALALGGAIGGRIADRATTDRPLFVAFAASGAYQLAVCVAIHRALPSLADLDEGLGVGLSAALFFGPSMVGLAAASPIAVRLLSGVTAVGTAAGRVYALSTIGSIVGVLATTFVSIPRFGSQATAAGLCAATLVLGLAGLARAGRAPLLGVAALALLPLAAPPPTPPGTVYARESLYHHVQVIRRGSKLGLVLDQPTSVHTLVDERGAWSGRYYDDFALAPLAVAGRRVLVLGMGAGGGIRTTRAVAPDAVIDAVDVDPGVVEAAAQFFGVAPVPGRLDVHVDDARRWLRQREGPLYDIVHVDLYRSGGSIPFHVATVEFYREVRRHLDDAGVLVMNLFDRSTDRALLQATAATLLAVFPSVCAVSREGGSHIVFASAAWPDAAALRQRIERASPEPAPPGARRAAAALKDLRPPPGAPRLTDDLAPIEALVRRALHP